MINIKTVKNKKELKKVFDFLSMTFYDDAKKNNEHYFTMSERLMEMEKQLEAQVFQRMSQEQQRIGLKRRWIYNIQIWKKSQAKCISYLSQVL